MNYIKLILNHLKVSAIPFQFRRTIFNLFLILIETQLLKGLTHFYTAYKYKQVELFGKFFATLIFDTTVHDFRIKPTYLCK